MADFFIGHQLATEKDPAISLTHRQTNACYMLTPPCHKNVAIFEIAYGQCGEKIIMGRMEHEIIAGITAEIDI